MAGRESMPGRRLAKLVKGGHTLSEGFYRSSRLQRPPLHELAKAFLERHLRVEADQALGLADVRQPPPDRSGFPRRTIFRREIDTHHAAECGGQFGEAGFGPAGDIEHVVGDRRIGCPQNSLGRCR